ncbi:hypothetical protein [Herbidospora mongoliensis]|uniref:hypothetical protein n=1 Tax=Herbidospora mongoliensis TaxID=688067 RepID=UPI00082ADDF3|nr:hypothetical protein [Herbidospora mongoliensis]
MAVLVGVLVGGAFTIGRNFEAFFGPAPDPCMEVADALTQLSDKLTLANGEDEKRLALRAALIFSVNNSECLGPVHAAEAQAMLEQMDADAAVQPDPYQPFWTRP